MTGHGVGWSRWVYGYLFFPLSLVVMLERTWHIAGLYVILCFSGSVHAVSPMWNGRFAQVG